MYARLADLVVLAHFAFIVFAVAGGLLVIRWPRLLWLHLPAALWGAAVVSFGWICPLTPLENRFAARAGQAGYQGSFIEHYLVPIIYPEGLTPAMQRGLAVFVVVANIAAYTWPRRRRLAEDASLESVDRRQGSGPILAGRGAGRKEAK